MMDSRGKMNAGGMLYVATFVLAVCVLIVSVNESEESLWLGLATLLFAVLLIYALFLMDCRCNRRLRTLQLYLPGGIVLWQWPINRITELEWVPMWRVYSPRMWGTCVCGTWFTPAPGLIACRGRFLFITRMGNGLLVVTPRRPERLESELRELMEGT